MFLAQCRDKKIATKVLNGTDKNNHLREEYFNNTANMKEGTDKQIAIAGFEDKNMLGWTCSCQSQPCLFVAVNYNALETYLFVRNKAMVLV